MSEERKRARWLAAGAIVVAAGVLGFLALGGIGESLVYYWSPSDLEAAGEDAFDATVRLGGLVEEGSIQRGADGLALDFRVTDGQRSVPVSARTVPPAMFREGIGVVVEGQLRNDGVFESRRLMVKHDNEYRPPGEEDDRDVAELAKTMKLDENAP